MDFYLQQMIMLMTYDDAVNTFKKHLQKLNQYGTDFEVWLATAIEHVHDIFGILSPQHSSITQIRNDYNISKIGDKSVDLQNSYAKKTKQLIENFIELLEEKKRIAITEAIQKNEATKKNEDKLRQQFDTLTNNYNSVSLEKQLLEQELNQLKNQPKTKNIFFKAAKGIYQINASLFWGVILTLLGGFFAFGVICWNYQIRQKSN